MKSAHRIGVAIMGENKEYITYPDEKGSINISEEVVAVIAGSAVLETEGVAGLHTARDISDLLGKKSLHKGVKIHVDEDAVTVDVYIMVELGPAISEVATNVQQNVASAVEATTGFSVAAVNVTVSGIYMRKDQK
jgi:uncharacterized alkaline shock family protein YloU